MKRRIGVGMGGGEGQRKGDAYAVVLCRVRQSHVNVELDVGPLKDFIQATNAVVMENHGVTTLGRTISEAYHRLNTLASEARRVMAAESLAAAKGTEVRYLPAADVEWSYGQADAIIYPSARPGADPARPGADPARPGADPARPGEDPGSPARSG